MSDYLDTLKAQLEERDAAMKWYHTEQLATDSEVNAALKRIENADINWQAIARALLPVVIAAEKLAENDANFRNRHNTCMCCGAVNIHMDYCEVKTLQTALAALEGVKE